MTVRPELYQVAQPPVTARAQAWKSPGTVAVVSEPAAMVRIVTASRRFPGESGAMCATHLVVALVGSPAIDWQR